MDDFFANQLSPEEIQRELAARQRGQEARSRHMSMPNPLPHGVGRTSQLSNMSDTAMVGGDSLDDIIRDNSQELQRRRSSVSQPYADPTAHVDGNGRLSMMDFSGADNTFRDFQFGNMDSSSADNMAATYGSMAGGMALPGSSTTFAQPNMMALADPTDFTNLSTDMMGNMISFSNLSVGHMAQESAPIDLFGSPSLATQFPANALDSVNTEFPMDLKHNNDPLGAASASATTGLGLDGDENGMAVIQTFDDPNTAEPAQPRQQPPVTQPTVRSRAQPQQQSGLSVDQRGGTFPAGAAHGAARGASGAAPFQAPLSTTPQAIPQAAITPQSASVATPAPASPREPAKGKSVYSKSGFDMLRALWYVATRKNPEVQLGAVDMSCAFVVCDVNMNDCPIIYASDNFQNLTGYSRHEIMGKNCRFLQAPDGIVEAGSKREFVENSAVYNLKRKVATGKEVQQSLINYRKGGKPFLNLLTMIPIPWDTEEVRFFVGFQIDLVECPDAISGVEMGGMQVNYKHSDIGQYIWTPPASSQWERENGQTLGVDDISGLLQQFNPKGVMSDWHKQSWDKMLLENTDDVVHVLSLKGLFLYLSPSCKKVLEYDSADLMGNSLSSICHPSDIVPVTRELKETTVGSPVNIVFRIRRKLSGYTWFESHGSLFVEQGKGRKCIILVGRKRPVFALHRRDLDANGGIGDSELWTKLSTSGMFLFVSSNVRSLLDLQPENLEGTSIQDLMRKESRPEFGRSIEKARRGKIVTCKHEVQNRRGQVLQAQTVLYPGDVAEGQKPTFLLAQTKLLKASSRTIAPATPGGKPAITTIALLSDDPATARAAGSSRQVPEATQSGLVPAVAGAALAPGTQEAALAADDNIFDELKTTRCTSWQYELRQMEKVNRLLAEELGQLLSNKKKRKRRKGVGNVVRDCANCHTRNTPEWRRGPSGQRDLCNSCGLRWAKQTGRVSPRTSSRGGNGDTQSKKSNSPIHSSPLQRELPGDATPPQDEALPNPASGPASSTTSGPNQGLTTPTAGMAKGHSLPPPSRPLLEGGSGIGGGGMGMTSIREEREQSA